MIGCLSFKYLLGNSLWNAARTFSAVVGVNTVWCFFLDASSRACQKDSTCARSAFSSFVSGTSFGVNVVPRSGVGCGVYVC